MKVLLLSHGAGPFGAERVLVALAEGLGASGHRVQLAFPHDGPAADAARQAGIDVVVGDRRRLPRRPAEVPGYLAAAAPDARDVHALVHRVDPDVVWVNSLYSPWTAIGARLSGRPVVWHLHERNLPPPAGWGLAALMGLTADRVAIVSGYLARRLRAYPWLRDRLRVVANPLLGAWEARSEPAGPFTVGFVGQLEPGKRPGDTVRAISRLDGVRGLVVGRGKAAEALEREIRRAGVEDRVDLPGYQEDIRPWLARMHCLSLPALHEGFGLVAIEAMAGGVPVVAARSGALPEVLGDAALFHAPRDVAGLATQIGRLRGDRALREELAARGRRRSRIFDRETWLQAAETVLREAVENRRRG
jgi:glycosyltransferase involved in cell wall biosynthesis